MVLFRSALKQVARRHGYLASLMCRPRLPNTLASGWHLHQSLLDRKTGANLFVSRDKAELLSPLAQHYLAGLLTHARAAAAFTTPTVNGYKRYHGVNSMAPIQAIWARDNRGVMVRALGEPGDASTHLENRAGEPLANPYLYMASQIHAGLDGIARKLAPGPSADAPYEIKAEPLPKSLAEAVAALNDSACFRSGFGDAFVDYLIRIKQAEIARCDSESAGHSASAAAVTAWEHTEYFDLAWNRQVALASAPKILARKSSLKGVPFLIQICGRDIAKKTVISDRYMVNAKRNRARLGASRCGSMEANRLRRVTYALMALGALMIGTLTSASAGCYGECNGYQRQSLRQ